MASGAVRVLITTVVPIVAAVLNAVPGIAVKVISAATADASLPIGNGPEPLPYVCMIPSSTAQGQNGLTDPTLKALLSN